jgi:hypothetical protein
MAWHSFMSVAHTSMDIPQIPGLPLHPTQVAERQKIEEARRQQPTGSRRADNGGTSTSVYTPTAGDLPATQGQSPRTKR